MQPVVERLDLVGWAAANRGRIASKLLEHGGILFRGFKLSGADVLEKLIHELSDGGPMEYSYRSTPRTRVEGRIYTSTEYPPDQTIPLHNEMSYSRSWPMKIWFFCASPASEGGQTPIADSRQVSKRIAPGVREVFECKKVMYVRNYGNGPDLSWEEVFQTEDRKAVERICQAASIEFEWKGESGLRTRQTCQASALHPSTGTPVWFNQAHLFHISSLTRQIREALLAEYAREDLPRNAYYGDGSEIEPAALDEIRRAYREETVIFQWRENDVLMLDNMLVAHGRMPFRGPRRILVGMADGLSGTDL
jgi:alpha-ketoglutarate-dependent taurine dioxygenase